MRCQPPRLSVRWCRWLDGVSAVYLTRNPASRFYAGVRSILMADLGWGKRSSGFTLPFVCSLVNAHALPLQIRIKKSLRCKAANSVASDACDASALSLQPPAGLMPRRVLPNTTGCSSRRSAVAWAAVSCGCGAAHRRALQWLLEGILWYKQRSHLIQASYH